MVLRGSYTGLNPHKKSSMTVSKTTLFGILVSLQTTLWYDNTDNTIRKCIKMARQNTFKILLLNDAYMIGEH